MKNLIFIGGTMGVGKTTASKALLKLLPKCAFLDGDWCWYADPFVVNDETKRMVVGNVSYMLTSLLSCSAYENVIFCWVMHLDSIAEEIISMIRCSDDQYVLHKYSLICSDGALRSRLEKDVDRGVREVEVIERSLLRSRCYDMVDTTKIDVSGISAECAAREIYNDVYPTA